MKKVEMMKKAIKDAEKNGWKWTADKEGLKWEYLDTRFIFSIDKDETNRVVTFEDLETGVSESVIVATEEEAWLCDSYHDFVRTIDEAIYWAARKIIALANHLY